MKENEPSHRLFFEAGVGGMLLAGSDGATFYFTLRPGGEPDKPPARGGVG